ncbi:MAG: ATP-binding protein [Nitrospirota bacterium]|jgi:signal transduction histidine kinase
MKSSKKEKNGYDLGLFIVHDIVQEHGGTIDVDSRMGHGATFTVIPPAKETETK